jgi:ParB-like nuclease domain
MKNIYLEELYCSVPSSNYSQQSIELLAESIVATGGLLRPLIVQVLPVDELEDPVFEVIDGFLPYWAAKHAEQDNLLLNRAPCWVIAEPDDLQFALQQLECIASLGCAVDDDDFALPVRGV